MSPSPPDRSARLSRSDRREALVEAAARLVSTGPIEAVSFEAVAEHLGISRPLVYKHFANRRELLAAVYRREADLLHAHLADQVEAAETVEGMFRALVRGLLRAEAERGATLAALRAAGGWDAAMSRRRRDRDRTTVRYFSTRMARHLGLERHDVEPSVAILLGALDAVLHQWRRKPTPEQSLLLEETYVDLVVGGIRQLARRRHSEATQDDHVEPQG